jgi:septal ring factor EnvC (AmiA/AmiB activator)
MKYLAIILPLIVPVLAHAQPTEFCKEALWYKKHKAGDALTITCDTAYLLNRYTFQYYQKLYKAFRSDDQRVKALTTSYSDMTMLYEARIVQQSEEYNRLRKSFDELSESSQQLLQKADQRLTSIQSSLAIADKSIQATQVNLALIEQNLKNEIRQSRKARLRNAATGFAAGVVATALVFVAVE